MGDFIPELVFLGSIRKHVKQAMWRKPESSTLSGPIPEFLPLGSCLLCVLALASLMYELSPGGMTWSPTLPPQVLLLTMFYHRSGDLN